MNAPLEIAILAEAFTAYITTLAARSIDINVLPTTKGTNIWPGLLALLDVLIICHRLLFGFDFSFHRKLLIEKGGGRTC
jgi:hypothetical protein